MSTQKVGNLIVQKHITRADLKANPKTLYVFGDNMAQRGYGGQAREMRGEPNAVGIPTKWLPSNSSDSFFHNDDMHKPQVQQAITEAFGKVYAHLIAGGDVVVPEDGVGTGLSQLHTRAPKIYAIINDHFGALKKRAEK